MNYEIYNTDHPDGTAHGGTAIIIRSSIKHHELPSYRTEHIQATSVSVEDKNGNITMSAVYCPPKHKITIELFLQYLNSLGNRFIAGGDWNAKHGLWGSRLATTRGRELKKAIDSLRLDVAPPSEPTHWPADYNRQPDVLDFFITKGLTRLFFEVETCLDGSSDHVPVLLTASTTLLNYDNPLMLYNRHTDWNAFRDILDEKLQLQIALKTEEDIENATKELTIAIQEACWRCTPEIAKLQPRHKSISWEIKLKILEKRRLRRIWHNTHHPDDRTALNKATRELKSMISEADEVTTQIRIESLSPTKASNYSLWREFKDITRPVVPKPPIRIPDSTIWARTQQEKADVFAAHLAKAFTPNDASPNAKECDMDEILHQDFQLDVPVQCVTPKEIRKTIRALKDKKAPGFDLIDKNILKELPKKGIMYLTVLFNSIIRLGYFPLLWKVSHIIMICKPSKPSYDIASYRPISLLPLLSKLFERILLRRLLGVISERNILPDHQFGFRREHATVEQVHRVCQVIRRSLEQKEYCSSVFLDIKQAFDKVWHKGLLCKVKLLLPHTFYGIIKSYLADRIFQVKEGECTSGFYDIKAGVPQGSVLGPVLYTLFTTDLPQLPEVTVATFADDTAILASHKDPVKSSEILQKSLQEIQRWMDRWRITASTSKSLHVTFTLRTGDCPPVKLGDTTLPHTNCVRYLGMHLDRRLTWKQHIQAKRQELNLKYQGLYWLLSRNSKMSIDNKLLIYKTALKPIWTYGIQLWGSASDSNIKIIQRAEDSILKQLANSPWFIKNSELHEHLGITTVKEEIQLYSTKYKSRLKQHPNQLAVQLTVPDCLNRLKRKHILNLDIP